jgi:hypothetical protein
MEDKKRDHQNLSQSEINLIQRLRQQPKMMERVQRILEIANSTEGPLKTADEIEELLLEEMRRLGNDTMTEWATQAEKRVGEELKQQDPTLLRRKKNAKLVVHLRRGRGPRTGLDQCDQILSTPVGRTIGRECTRKIPPVATGAHRLWMRTLLCPRGQESAGALWV